MNRRHFLSVFAAAAAVAAVDPERLLWTPGAKTIIDLGSTKQIVPVTDDELLDQMVFVKEAVSEAEFKARFLSTPDQAKWVPLRRAERGDPLNRRDRDITLTLGSTSFKYKGEQLVSLHTEQELAMLDRPFGKDR